MHGAMINMGFQSIFSTPEKGCEEGHAYRWADSLYRRNKQQNFYVVHSTHCDVLELVIPNCAFVGLTEVLLNQQNFEIDTPTVIAYQTREPRACLW